MSGGAGCASGPEGQASRESDRELKSRRPSAGAAQILRFRDKPNSENRLLGTVQKLHLPFAVLLEVAGDAADHIAAHAGQFFPGGIAIGMLGAKIGGAGILAISDAKKIERHGVT